ncbi:hypothetical protein SNE40_018581 [Patella caerulea]|uniref:Uncharacterized protein n=1 Tax=Patella caerulea TaxID=87958 RepID=A0AAN8J5A1_PATCE
MLFGKAFIFLVLIGMFSSCFGQISADEVDPLFGIDARFGPDGDILKERISNMNQEKDGPKPTLYFWDSDCYIVEYINPFLPDKPKICKVRTDTDNL